LLGVSVVGNLEGFIDGMRSGIIDGVGIAEGSNTIIDGVGVDVTDDDDASDRSNEGDDAIVGIAEGSTVGNSKEREDCDVPGVDVTDDDDASDSIAAVWDPR